VTGVCRRGRAPAAPRGTALGDRDGCVPRGAPRLLAPHLSRELGGFRFRIRRDDRRVDVSEARSAKGTVGTFARAHDDRATARSEHYGREPRKLAPRRLVGDDDNLVGPREPAVLSNTLATETIAVPPETTSLVDGVTEGTGTLAAFTPSP